MVEEALVKERRVTGRESRTFGSVSNNSIAPKRSQICPMFLYNDLAKCNFDENTTAAWVHTCFKCVAQKMERVPMTDGSTPDAGLDSRGRVITWVVPIPGPWDKWFIPIFTHRARGGRLTPEGIQELWIGNVLSPKQ